MAKLTSYSVLYSTSYASAIPGMMESFNIDNETLVVLGLTTYLMGLATGSVILAPLSEMYGRRPIYIVSLAFFIVLVIPCALAKNLETILVTRFFGALAGSAMISNAPGTVADIVTDEYRALAFSIWSIGPMNGPVLGPIIGGFVFQSLGWRWTNWVVLIGAGVALLVISTVKETYAPAILRRKSALQRKKSNDDRYWSRYDERLGLRSLLAVNLSRPFVMAVTEPICIFWDIYIAIVYGILYLCFVAYPIVFSQQRGWSPGLTGLAYTGIGIGGLITILSEPLLRALINSYRPNRSIPASPLNAAPPEAMLAVVCIAAVLVPIGELVFAWTSPPTVHWVFPILAGIPFGAGNCAVFIYASNYLVHSYGIYAASALAGNAVLRSVLGGCLPLAGPALYGALGSRWAGTLLGGLEVLCIPIPWVFWRYGARIRGRSRMIGLMRADQERLEARARRKAVGVVAGGGSAGEDRAGGMEYVSAQKEKAGLVERDREV
ncbi:MFS general substrate transporter [Pseudovirgaria hyperparasitica]|uniref:MFS general substrate transporter n=1 Tax=Pseudovirgaria hyperparasitica TaxID=470096 RepID=A0A6A6VUJ7_9PEZI|nr:MFS general substrate transporter [Pseudovirgaria hyperparasitica]KAF2753404.1 MFS general substrate transporter [Pseudovirgaria hyperparasitica]